MFQNEMTGSVEQFRELQVTRKEVRAAEEGVIMRGAIAESAGKEREWRKYYEY